jgi:microcystin-dependent protein
VSSPFIGEIRMFAGNFAPAGWMFCDGQLLPISENDALFTLIGTTYGGDGEETFALPNLQSRVPIHMGNNAGTTFQIGEMAGVEAVTLTSQQIPTHTHPFMATINPASSNSPTNTLPALTEAATIRPYGTDNPAVNLAPTAISPAGGSQPHENVQPFQCINYIISLFGVFPTQN